MRRQAPDQESAFRDRLLSRARCRAADPVIGPATTSGFPDGHLSRRSLSPCPRSVVTPPERRARWRQDGRHNGSTSPAGPACGADRSCPWLTPRINPWLPVPSVVQRARPWGIAAGLNIGRRGFLARTFHLHQLGWHGTALRDMRGFGGLVQLTPQRRRVRTEGCRSIVCATVEATATSPPATLFGGFAGVRISMHVSLTFLMSVSTASVRRSRSAMRCLVWLSIPMPPFAPVGNCGGVSETRSFRRSPTVPPTRRQLS